MFFQYRVPYRILFYGVLCIGAAISLIGFFGSWHVAFDGTNHFRPHLIALSVLALGLAWFFDRYRALGVASVCLAINLIALNWFLPLSAPIDKVSLGDRLSVATYNVWGRNDDLAEIEFFLRSENPDVVVLQEMTVKNAALFDRVRDIYPFQIDCVAEIHCKLALLSKHGFVKSDVTNRSAESPPMIWAQFEMISESGRESFTIVGTHLHRALPQGQQFQDKDSLIDFLKGVEGDVALLGDFNATPWSHVVQDISKRTNLKLLHRFLPTWPARGVPAQFPIDLFLVSDGLANHGVRRGLAGGSDHRPVLADIGFVRDVRIVEATDRALPLTEIADRLTKQ